MIFLAAVTVALVLIAGGLFVAMHRRDDSVLGLAGLLVTLGAAFSAVMYGGLDSL